MKVIFVTHTGILLIHQLKRTIEEIPGNCTFYGEVIRTSTDLVNWTEDSTATASQNVTSTTGAVETVEATLSGSLPLAQPKLFLQVRAN